MRDKYKLTDDDLKRIQFYLSDAVVLKRGEELGREKGNDNGALIIKSGKNIEQIVFKRNTSCIVSQVVDEKKLSVIIPGYQLINSFVLHAMHCLTVCHRIR